MENKYNTNLPDECQTCWGLDQDAPCHQSNYELGYLNCQHYVNGLKAMYQAEAEDKFDKQMEMQKKLGLSYKKRLENLVE